MNNDHAPITPIVSDSATVTASGIPVTTTAAITTATVTYTLTALSTPGTYFFRCDVHPTVRTGQLIVQYAGRTLSPFSFVAIDHAGDR